MPNSFLIIAYLLNILNNFTIQEKIKEFYKSAVNYYNLLIKDEDGIEKRRIHHNRACCKYRYNVYSDCCGIADFFQKSYKNN